MSIVTINLDKAKLVAHRMRRAARAEEFKPYDDAIAKQIPGQIEGAEAERQKIRDKYRLIQADIDAAQDVDGIKAALGI